MSWNKGSFGKGLALVLIVLVALSGVPGLYMLNGTGIAVAEEGREDAAKLLVYSRMIARGLETLGLSGASADQVAATLGASIADAEEILSIAEMTPQEIFSLDAETVKQLKEKAEHYYGIILGVIESGIDREELKRTLDQALIQRIADVVSRIGESLNDTTILQAAEQVRNATSMEEARRLLVRVVERLQALNIYRLSETLDDALLRSLEKLVDEADMGYLEDSIEKMREEINEIRELATRYGTVLAERIDPEVESKLSLALEKITAVETTLESMGTVTQTIANATGNATGITVDPTRVVEAGVKARISLLTEKLTQIETQLKSMLESGMADPQWAAHAMNMSDLVRQHLANATAFIAEGNIEAALSEVSKADEILTRLAFEVRYKSVEMQALVQARIAAAQALMVQVEIRINETQDLINRLYDTANATGAQATLATLEQARLHLQNAIQLTEQARVLLQANDTQALDLLNQALQEVIQAKAMANAARASLSIELQVLAQVSLGNQTTGGNITLATNQTISTNATLGNGTQANVTTPAPNGTAPVANQTGTNATQVTDAAARLQLQVETRLAYAHQLVNQSIQLGSDSAYEYALRAAEVLQLALNLSQAGDLVGAKRLLDQADYYIIKAEKELAEKGFEAAPTGVDYRIWEIKKDIVEVEYKLKLINAKMELANITDPLANELAIKALELLNQSKTLLSQGDLAGALDALYKAEDLVSYMDDLVEAWFEEEEMSHYIEGTQAQIAEVEYLVNKALAKIEQAKAHPGFTNSTAAQALVDQAYQMTLEAKTRLQEAIELMNQGQDYTAQLRVAANLAKGAIELAEQAVDLAEKAWEKSMEEAEKRIEKAQEILDKAADLREKAVELRTKIAEMRATGAYSEDMLAEVEKIVGEAESLISQAEEVASTNTGEAQGLLSKAKALLERASRVLEAAVETKTTTTGTSTTTETVTYTETRTETQEYETRLDHLEDKAYKILDKLEELNSIGAIEPALASEIKNIVSEALAQIEAARTALSIGTDAKPYIETAEELLSKAEDLLEKTHASTITTTTTETRTSKEEKRAEQGHGIDYEEKVAEIEAKASKIEGKATSLLEAGLLSASDYDAIIALVSKARTLLEEAKTTDGGQRVKEALIEQAKSLLEQAEHIMEQAGTNKTYTTTETTTTAHEADTTTKEYTEKEETVTTTTTNEQEYTTTSPSPEEDLLNNLKEKISDSLDKVSDFREKALEIQVKASKENSADALNLANQALDLISTAASTLEEAQALLSVGDTTTAQSLVEKALSYLTEAESLLDEAESLVD